MEFSLQWLYEEYIWSHRQSDRPHCLITLESFHIIILPILFLSNNLLLYYLNIVHSCINHMAFKLYTIVLSSQHDLWSWCEWSLVSSDYMKNTHRQSDRPHTWRSGFSLGFLLLVLHHHLYSLHHQLSYGIQSASLSLYGSTQTFTLF